ncbi:class I SAM-dependent DNA methyltransferase [Tahibacter sp. UC22_41]|uniref:class I SAM-dependent DNA methyltransferase n=1 Tax=Tahibacter sp. UC22_41 TaxID=3350178 RepID=UPI0036DB688F
MTTSALRNDALPAPSDTTTSALGDDDLPAPGDPATSGPRSTNMPALHDTPSGYGDGCADFYDQIYAPPSRTAIARLAALAGSGPVLEAGIGTGRYALPLAATGVAMHGIDASPAMLAALAAKPGGAAIPVTLGDFATMRVPGRFRLITCLADTLSLLADATAQASALVQFAAALQSDGLVLIETATCPTTESTDTHVDIALTTATGTRRYAARRCGVGVTALDDWATAAGLSLHERWRDWHGSPWNGEAGSVFSLYRHGGADRRRQIAAGAQD